MASISSTSLANFNTIEEEKVRSLKVNFNPIQLGTGTASLDNVRDIYGWSGVDVYNGRTDFKIKYNVRTTSSAGVTFTINEAGVVTANGTPTSASTLAIGYIDVVGNETIYMSIAGDMTNVTYNAPYLYDINNNSITSSIGDLALKNGLDLSQYPGVKKVLICIKRSVNGVPMEGSCSVTVWKDSLPQINRYPIVFNNGKNIGRVWRYASSTPSNVNDRKVLTNTYGTTLSSDVYNLPDMPVVITQSQWPNSSVKYHYQNGYFIVIVDGLTFDEYYDISFKVTNITNNPLNASLSDMAIVVPSGGIKYGPDIVGDKVIFRNIKFTPYQSNYDRTCIEIRNCGMSFTFSEFMVTAPNTQDHTFEPNVQYGGYVDLATGTLFAEWFGFDVTSNTVVGRDSSDSTKFTARIRPSENNFPALVTGAANIISNRFSTSAATSSIGYMTTLSDRIYFKLPMDEISEDSADGAKAWFLAHPTRIVYKLETPITYQLEPQEIRTLAGTNLLWSNAESVSIKFDEHITQTASSGNTSDSSTIAHFSSDVANNISSLRVDFKADKGKRWKGGEGKNLFNGFYNAAIAGGGEKTEVSRGITFTIKKDGTVVANGTSLDGSDNAQCSRGINLPPGNYYCTAGDFYQYTGDSTYIDYFIWDSAANARAKKWDGTTNMEWNKYGGLSEFQILEDHSYSFFLRVYRNGYTANNVVFYPMICASTETDASFEPYENLSPMTGWNGVEVKRCGRNFLENNSTGSKYSEFTLDINPDKSIVLNGVHTAQRPVIINFETDPSSPYAQNSRHKTLPNAKYWGASVPGGTGQMPALQICMDNQGLYNTYTGKGFYAGNTFEITNDYKYNFMRLVVNANETFENKLLKPMILLQSDLGRLDYEPYHGDKLYANWTNEVGTLYGGYIDLVTGELVQTYGYIADLSQLDWTYLSGESGGMCFRSPSISNIKQGTRTNKLINPLFDVVQNGESFNGNWDNVVYSVNNYIYIHYRTANGDTPTLKEYISGLQLIYELEAPIRYQLNPQKIHTFKGINNYWSDDGSVSVSYAYQESNWMQKLSRRIMLNAPHIESTTSASVANFRTNTPANIKECKLTFTPIQEGSGTPSQTNIRPFVGMTGCNITRCGINMLDNINNNIINQTTDHGITYTVNSDGSVTASGTCDSDPSHFWMRGIRNMPEGNFYGTVGSYPQNDNRPYVWNGNTSGRIKKWDGLTDMEFYDNGELAELRFPQDRSNMSIDLRCDSNMSINNIFYPAVVHPNDYSNYSQYEQYNGITLPVSWQSQAGTVYGGTLDLLTGKLIVDTQYVTFGTAAQSKGRITTITKRSATGMTTFWLWFSRNGVEGYDMATDGYILCDMMASGTAANVNSNNYPTISNYAAGTYPGSIYLSLPTADVGDTQDTIWAYLLQHPFHIVAHIKTPLTYNITPLSPFKTLFGSNNIWSNVGNIEVSYWTH